MTKAPTMTAVTPSRDGLLAEHEFINELGNRIYVALRGSDDDLVTIIIQTIRAKSDSSSENTVTRREALELAKVVLKGLDRAAPHSTAGAGAACSAVSKILCGEETCTDAGNWRCPQDIETADQMIVEIVDTVFSLATKPPTFDRQPTPCKQADEVRGSDAAEADRYFDMAGEFGNRIQRAVALIEDYDRHGSVDHSVAFEMKKILDPEAALSTTGEPKR